MASSAGQRPFNDGPSILNQPRVIPGAGPAPHNDSRHGWAYEKGPSGNLVGQEPRRECSCHVAGLWKQAQAWMPKRSGHAVNGGPEARRERPVTWEGTPPTHGKARWTC
jgi:hypothetical protein